MVTLARILKDYADAGGLNGRLALWGFVDEAVFLTKTGAVGMALRIAGADYECLDHSERRLVAHRFEQALRQLDEPFRVYQYLIKRRAQLPRFSGNATPLVDSAVQRRARFLEAKGDDLFEVELVFVVLYEGWALSRQSGRSLRWSRRAHLNQLLSNRSAAAALEGELARATATLRQKVESFAILLADTIRPVPLSKGETFRFLRQLINYAPHKVDGVSLKYDTHLDFYVADSSVECHRDHLDVDGYQVKVLTLKDPPAKTFANVLEDLLAVASPFIACLEWQRLANDRMRRDIHARRRHFFNKKVSMVNYLSSQTRPEEMLVDDSATATVHELGQALTEMEVHGRFFGSCSLTIVAIDKDERRLDRTVAACTKAFAGHDGALHTESYNLLNAWLAVVPGNSAHNLRRLALLNTNFADLSFLFTLHSGDKTSAHLGDKECLAVFETEHQTPYFWNLHYDDVGHVLIQGATGAGKSFLVNFVLTHVQKYDPTTVIFDLGGSYHKLTSLLGGSTWRMGLDRQGFRINPFCLAATPENLHFIFAFVRVLLQSGGQYACSLTDDRDLYEAIENMYALDADQRRLFTLVNMLPRHLGEHLRRWVQGGPYAAFFDNEHDTLTLNRMQCFDFEGLEKFPAVIEPLLFYVLHRANAAIQDRDTSSQLKVFVLDEAWRFARDPLVTAYIAEALKTWRKRNAAMILATQSTEDFAGSDLLRTVVESCPTKFFLANPGMDVDRVRQLFHLNETEASIITRLAPRRQALLKRPDLARVINLNVDPESYWIYTNTPPDNARLQAALKESIAGAAAPADLKGVR